MSVITKEIEKDGIMQGIKNVFFNEEYNNKPCICKFMKEYKGKRPYVAFILEFVRNSSICMFIRPGIKTKEMDKAMTSFFAENKEWFEKHLAEKEAEEEADAEI